MAATKAAKAKSDADAKKSDDAAKKKKEADDAAAAAALLAKSPQEIEAEAQTLTLLNREQSPQKVHRRSRW